MFTVIKELDGAFNNKLIWSGQHYDYAMVKKNFNNVQLRRPDIQFKIEDHNKKTYTKIIRETKNKIDRLKIILISTLDFIVLCIIFYIKI